MADPLTAEEIARLVEAHVDRTVQGTHYEGCYLNHSKCAILALVRGIDALRERLAASEARYLDLRKRTPPDCTVENFTKMGAQLVVTAQRLAAAEAVIEDLLAIEPLFTTPGAWDAKEQALRNVIAKARALTPTEAPGE